MEGTGKWWEYEVPEGDPTDWSDSEASVYGGTMACHYLSLRGLDILERDCECGAGVIDIVAEEEDGTVVLVVTMTRLRIGDESDSLPSLDVDGECRRHYRDLALTYLLEHPAVTSMRFDVIAIDLLGKKDAKLRHLFGSLSWEG